MAVQQKHCQTGYDASLFSALYYTGVGERYSEEQLVDHLYQGEYQLDLEKMISDKPYFKEKSKFGNFNNLLNMLWKPSQKIGCAMACCATSTFWYCDLYPVRKIPMPFEAAKAGLAKRGDPMKIPKTPKNPPSEEKEKPSG